MAACKQLQFKTVNAKFQITNSLVLNNMYFFYNFSISISNYIFMYTVFQLYFSQLYMYDNKDNIY